MVSERTLSLMTLADEEFSAGVQLVASNPRQATYLLSQAAEKAARAICEVAGVQVGTTHNFGQIAASLPAEHPFREAIDAFTPMSSSSTKFRYPTPAGRIARAPSSEELHTQQAEVGKFVEDVRSFLSENSLGAFRS